MAVRGVSLPADEPREQERQGYDERDTEDREQHHECLEHDALFGGLWSHVVLRLRLTETIRTLRRDGNPPFGSGVSNKLVAERGTCVHEVRRWRK